MKCKIAITPSISKKATAMATKAPIITNPAAIPDP